MLNIGCIISGAEFDSHTLIIIKISKTSRETIIRSITMYKGVGPLIRVCMLNYWKGKYHTHKCILIQCLESG